MLLIEGVQERGKPAHGSAVPSRARADNDAAWPRDRATVVNQSLDQGCVLAHPYGREFPHGGVGIGSYGQVGPVHVVVALTVDPGSDDSTVCRG